MLIKIYNLWLIGISIPCWQTSERPQAELNREADYPRFVMEPSESGYFPNCRVRDKSYIPLQSQSEFDFPDFLLWPKEISLIFGLKLASCSRYFGILGQKMRSPQ